jgi:arginine-tRNA-protein transferase
VDWASSLESILYGNQAHNIFNTHIMNVYDGEKLVAAGFFDIGTHAAAGICNFYDPEYRKFSLGKFLYLSQVLYCIEQRMTYFYPGYITPGLPMFDYKVDMHPASVECYDPISRSWDEHMPTDPENTAVDRMENALCCLLPRLHNLGVDARFIVNVGFSLNYTSKFDMPFAIYICPPEGRKEQYAITFDPDTNEYYIFDTTEANCKESLSVIGQETYCMQSMELKTPLFILMNPGLAAETMADIVDYWSK